MMDACEAWLLERNVPKLNLMVRTSNASASGFYAALGYNRDEVSVFSRSLQ
jgi:ribosomal protein S18 acetylase RimI-like enzyme